MESLPDECQYLTDEHVQEKNLEIMKTHLETIWLLTTRGGDDGRRCIKQRGTYPVIRELHLQIEDQDVRERCERIVHTIMGEEVSAESREELNGTEKGRMVELPETDNADEGTSITQKAAEEDEDEDSAIIPMF